MKDEMPKRLLHLLNYKPLGTRAIDHFVVEYVQQATARGWQVSIGFTAAPPPEYAALFGRLGADVIQFETPFTAAAAQQLQRTVKPVDVLQTSFLSVFEKPLLSLKLNGFTKKLVVIDHSSGTGPSRSSLLRPLRWLRGRRVGRIVDGIACVSEFNAKRDIERVFLPADKITVVPNGIDLRRFPFVVNRNNDPLKVVYAGQLIAAKGVRTFLETVKPITHLNFEVLIAGDGPLRDELEAMSVPYVTFLGQVADMPAFFGTADVVVVPSEWAEAFGLVAIEAMACGAAVLASDAGALPEVVGDAGVIFKAANVVEMTFALDRLLSDAPARVQLQALGRKRVEERFQLDMCVRRHLDFIEKCNER